MAKKKFSNLMGGNIFSHLSLQGSMKDELFKYFRHDSPTLKQIREDICTSLPGQCKIIDKLAPLASHRGNGCIISVKNAHVKSPNVSKDLFIDIEVEYIHDSEFDSVTEKFERPTMSNLSDGPFPYRTYHKTYSLHIPYELEAGELSKDKWKKRYYEWSEECRIKIEDEIEAVEAIELEARLRKHPVLANILLKKIGYSNPPVYDAFDDEIKEGDKIDVQKAGVFEVVSIDGELYFSPYGKPEPVRSYTRNGLHKVK